MIVIHGAFSTAREMERMSGFSRLADREGFIVVYPNGIGLLGYLQHWNVGQCCGKAAKDGVDDLGFVRAVVEGVAKVDSIQAAYDYDAAKEIWDFIKRFRRP